MILAKPTFLESCLLSSMRYESELHDHTVVHSDASILPDNNVKPLATRSNHIEQYGVRPDNYEITCIIRLTVGTKLSVAIAHKRGVRGEVVGVQHGAATGRGSISGSEPDYVDTRNDCA